MEKKSTLLFFAFLTVGHLKARKRTNLVMNKLITITLFMLLISANAFSQKTFFIDFKGNSGDGVSLIPTTGNWNSMTMTSESQLNWGIPDLIDSLGNASGYSFMVKDKPFESGYSLGQSPSASSIFPESATIDLLTVFAGSPAPEVELTGLDDSKEYSFTVFGSRAGTIADNGSRIVNYIFKGANSDSASLECRGNVSDNAVISNIIPINGKIIFTMTCASHSLVNAMRIQEKAVIKTTYLIDFNGNNADGSTLNPTPGNWNNMTMTSSGQANWGLDNLIATDGTVAPIGFKVLGDHVFDAGGSNGDSTGITPDFPGSAKIDALFVYAGSPEAQVQISGLDNAKSYTFTCFGSRLDNGSGPRFVEYKFVGSNADSAQLDVMSNKTNTAIVSKIQPSGGIITFHLIGITSHSHINCMKIEIEKGTTVIVGVTGVTVSPNPATVEIGSPSQLTATIIPANANNKNVTWNSDNTAVATVDAAGVVTAVSLGNANITATTQDGGFTATSAVTVISTSTKVNYTATAPVIDQTIDACWSNANIYQITNKTAGLAVPADFSAQWRALWDNTNLYILVEVKDPSPSNDSSPNWWDDAASEIYIDGDNSKKISYDGVNDMQFGFGYNYTFVGTGDSYPNGITGITFATQVLTGGYNQEISIPWTIIGVTPAVNNLMGFDASVDIDENGGSRDAQVTWFDKSGQAWGKPSKFGTVMLTNETFNAVSSIKAGSVKLYPNPAKNNVTLEVKAIHKDEIGQIYSAFGKLVKEFNVTGLKQNVNIEDLPGGVYMVRYNNSSMKFIKK
jgi:hypothetical protein